MHVVDFIIPAASLAFVIWTFRDIARKNRDEERYHTKL